MATTGASASDTFLFNETFTVSDVNHAKYDRVSRITAHSPHQDTKIMLDINTEIYPVHEQEHVHMALVSSLSLDGTKDESKRGWRPPVPGEMTLADQYDYVCHGKVYRFEEGEGESMQVFGESFPKEKVVFVSFGGLLLHMEGPFRKMSPLRIDYVYLLLKK
ncbi:MAG: DNA-directed RNA polymerases I, II, and III subunit RPABC3 [Vezdaea aestivalis]|nr:MAG: DNA-directed RNA polymerases I, II, and III subunit RPABC3 [Vezdaea aestivalis]